MRLSLGRRTMGSNSGFAGSFPKSAWTVVLTCFLSVVFLNTTSAQFGIGFPGQMNLPQNDFTWTWGDQRSGRRGIDDFSIFGTEAGFRCDLKGKLRFGSRLSRMDIRKIESDLRSSMSFVSAVARVMNDLDARREIDWATLECEKRKREER